MCTSTFHCQQIVPVSGAFHNLLVGLELFIIVVVRHIKVDFVRACTGKIRQETVQFNDGINSNLRSQNAPFSYNLNGKEWSFTSDFFLM